MNINKFPRYKMEYENDSYSTWLESLQKNGYPSTMRPDGGLPWVYEMDEVEYTHFVLKWS